MDHIHVSHAALTWVSTELERRQRVGGSERRQVIICKPETGETGLNAAGGFNNDETE